MNFVLCFVQSFIEFDLDTIRYYLQSKYFFPTVHRAGVKSFGRASL